MPSFKVSVPTLVYDEYWVTAKSPRDAVRKVMFGNFDNDEDEDPHQSTDGESIDPEKEPWLVDFRNDVYEIRKSPEEKKDD